MAVATTTISLKEPAQRVAPYSSSIPFRMLHRARLFPFLLVIALRYNVHIQVYNGYVRVQILQRSVCSSDIHLLEEPPLSFNVDLTCLTITTPFCPVE